MKNHDHKIDHLRAENDMIDHKLKHNLPLYHDFTMFFQKIMIE